MSSTVVSALNACAGRPAPARRSPRGPRRACRSPSERGFAESRPRHPPMPVRRRRRHEQQGPDVPEDGTRLRPVEHAERGVVDEAQIPATHPVRMSAHRRRHGAARSAADRLQVELGPPAPSPPRSPPRACRCRGHSGRTGAEGELEALGHRRANVARTRRKPVIVRGEQLTPAAAAGRIDTHARASRSAASSGRSTEIRRRRATSAPSRAVRSIGSSGRGGGRGTAVGHADRSGPSRGGGGGRRDAGAAPHRECRADPVDRAPRRRLADDGHQVPDGRGGGSPGSDRHRCGAATVASAAGDVAGDRPSCRCHVPRSLGGRGST